MTLNTSWSIHFMTRVAGARGIAINITTHQRHAEAINNLTAEGKVFLSTEGPDEIILELGDGVPPSSVYGFLLDSGESCKLLMKYVA